MAWLCAALVLVIVPITQFTHGAELVVIEREFTLAGINPALDDFIELGTLLKKQAEEAAVAAGHDLARAAA